MQAHGHLLIELFVLFAALFGALLCHTALVRISHGDTNPVYRC
jgi:hypothetical protein